METAILLAVMAVVLVGLVRDVLRGRLWRAYLYAATVAVKLVLLYVAAPLVLGTTLVFPSLVSAVLWNVVDAVQIVLILSVLFSLAFAAVKEVRESAWWGRRVAQ